jgi:hypothetical protein
VLFVEVSGLFKGQAKGFSNPCVVASRPRGSACAPSSSPLSVPTFTAASHLSSVYNLPHSGPVHSIGGAQIALRFPGYGCLEQGMRRTFVRRVRNSNTRFCSSF